MSAAYRGRLGLQQRVLPDYRVPFFDLLAAACEGGLSVFAGQPRPTENIVGGAPRLARHAPSHNIHILREPLYLCYQRGLQHWLDDWDPHALVVEANPRYLSTSAAVKWMRSRGRPVLGWGLGAPPPHGPLAGIQQALRSRFLGQFDGLIAYSRRGAREYAAAGFPTDRIFIATNSVSNAPAHAPAPRQLQAQTSVLFVGRLQARKHVDRLLRACAEMPEPRPRLIVVGDGPEAAALQTLAAKIFPSAEFVGARHGAELDPFFAHADLFVLPGTGGLAVQQAMAHGLPVIVAQGDGTQDDLVRPGNGWQIPPDDHAALLAALREALSNPARLHRMGQESYRIVSEEVNLGSMVSAFVSALNSLKVVPE